MTCADVYWISHRSVLDKRENGGEITANRKTPGHRQCGICWRLPDLAGDMDKQVVCAAVITFGARAS